MEKLNTIVEGLLEQAGGEQWRCPQCGSFGPKQPTVSLREVADVLGQLARLVLTSTDDAPATPIQVNVYTGEDPPE